MDNFRKFQKSLKLPQQLLDYFLRWYLTHDWRKFSIYFWKFNVTVKLKEQIEIIDIVSNVRKKFTKKVWFSELETGFESWHQQPWLLLFFNTNAIENMMSLNFYFFCSIRFFFGMQRYQYMKNTFEWNRTYN